MNRTYGFTLFPDEFGYWSYAAGAAGYDWSDITALGSYYSYGYSLILFPIFTIFHNGVTAYRAAVTFNFILLAVGYLLLVKISRNELYAAIAMLYPAGLFDSRMTMAEVLLMTCFILCCLFLQEYLKKRKMGYLLGYLVMLAYLYSVHMRAVGVLVAGLVTLLFILTGNDHRKRHGLIMVIVMAALLGIGWFAKKYAISAMYAASEDVAVNDYSGQLGKIQYLFTGDGLRDGLCGLAGKLLYMGIATFGLAWFGIIRLVKKRKESPLYLFTGLSLLAETAICAVYNIWPLRVDSVVYGRYHEFVFPVLMVLGLYELMECRKPFLKTGIILLAELPLTWMTAALINIYGLTNIHGYVMAGMSYLHYVWEMEPGRLIWMTWLFHILMAAVIVLVAAIAGQHPQWRFLLLGICVLEIAIAMHASAIYQDPSAQGAYRDTTIVDKIRELRRDNTDGRLVYVREDENDLISMIQFMMREEDVVVISKEEYASGALAEEDMVLLDYRSDYSTQLEEDYDAYLQTGHFILYWNIP